MKKLFLSVILAVAMIPAASFAQAPAAAATSMGFAEVSVGFGGMQGDVEGIDPFLGFNISGFYNVMPNVAVGASIRYQMYSVDSGDASSIMFGVEGRYYFPINNQMRVYGLAGLGYDMYSISIDTPLGTVEGDDTAIYIQVGGGVEYALSPVMSVGGQLRYQLNMWDEGDGDANDWYLGAVFSYKF
ncbi:MAG: porin family protein [Deltaproteobacteria bacterium]|nr:porin family protein [Deltaproteobacteria bacterium]